MTKWASLPLRLSLGVVFVTHGLQKVLGLFGGSGMDNFTKTVSNLGFVPADLWAYAAAYVELVGGICLIIGFGTRIAAALIFILIVVAGVKVHLPNGFFLAKGGVEYTFVIAFSCISLMLLGTGKLGITRKF